MDGIGARDIDIAATVSTQSLGTGGINLASLKWPSSFSAEAQSEQALGILTGGA